MIDPGHPFSVPYENLIAALEDRLRNGVEQPDRTRFVFQRSVTSYELPRTADAVTRVSGLQGRSFTVFRPGVHYQFSNNRVLWISDTDRPDENSRLDVDYTYRERPAGLTDFNPGSVVGTLVRAVAREMKLLYEQMDEAYRRAFIDVATGVALDSVVALLGLGRNPALKAQGDVTFLRRAPAGVISIPARTRVADESGRTFSTTVDARILEAADEFRAQSAGVLRTTDQIARLIGIWRREDDPETAPPFATLDTAPGQPFGADERTITLDPATLPSGELRIRYAPKSVTVPIEAVEPGPEGNVNAGTIVVMPTPPPGVAGVTNERRVEGGQSPEPDDQLRERAKHALERAGNATLNAIKFAVLDVDGIEGVEIIDHSVDETVPLGEVRVRYSASDLARVRPAVQDVVDRTRAAGILARLETINPVFISGTFYLIPDAVVPATSLVSFVAAVNAALDALTIGEPVSVRRLNALAFALPGLVDVAEAQLSWAKENPAQPGEILSGEVTDPFLIERNEVVRPEPAQLQAVLLTGLRVPGPPRTLGGGTFEIDLELTDTTGAAVTWRDFSIDLGVTLRATLLAAPDQPPQRIGSFTRAIRFDGVSLVTLTIGPADTAGFRPAEHASTIELFIAAAAYPGVAGVTTTLDLA